MGHLINPIAFRLGINKSWESTWFIRNIYYAEFLHNLLDLRNFAYRIFSTKHVRKIGIFLSEIFFFKLFKTYVINIYLYHLELEKVSYRFINKLYVNYYKKEYTQDKKFNFLPYYWFLHNADLYAFMFIFYNIFFNATDKFKDTKKKYMNVYKLDYDNNIKSLINKFNKVLLKKLKGKDKIVHDLDFFMKNLINKIEKYSSIIEWKSFIFNMKELRYIFKKKFRFDYNKRDLILSKLKKYKNIYIYTDLLKKLKKKYNIKKKFFFDLIYSYMIRDVITFNNLKKQLIYNKKKKKKEFKLLFNNEIKNLGKFSRKNTIWNKKLIMPDVDYDDFIESSNNFIDNFFFNIFLYLGKKVKFAKYKNHRLFKKKWGYIIKFLKFLNTFQFGNWFKASNFFLYLSASLNMNLKARKSRKWFNVRDMIYRYLYIWLGKYFFFPIFKKITAMLEPIFINLTNIPNVKVNYFFISVNDVSARFLAIYVSLKLKKLHNLKSIINPLKRELWRLSRRSRKKERDFVLINKVMKRKSKKKFIRLLNIMFIRYNKNFYNKIKKNQSILFIDFFLFKLYIYNLNKKKKINIIDKFIKVNIFFDLLYGKLQNDFNLYFEREKIRKKMKWKKNKRIFYFIFSRLNYITYNNIKKFKMININYLFVFTNIIKYYMHFSYFRYIWNITDNFNKRNSRHNLSAYKKSGLIGFKMAFKGRFSRKQRASSIWYANGRVSLNRLDLKVDYAFIKIPLKNSIVSIKIWLFKNTKFDRFKFILNF